jgi:hypothetical protein
MLESRDRLWRCKSEDGSRRRLKGRGVIGAAAEVSQTAAALARDRTSSTASWYSFRAFSEDASNRITKTG